MPSTSISEQIGQHIKTVLTGATPAGAFVWRDRADAMTRDESPALLIELFDEDTSTLGGGQMRLGPAVDRCQLTVLVVACARDADWQSAADGVRTAAHQVLCADPLLRDYAIRRGRCEWRPASTDLPFGYASQQYHLTYLSSAADISALAM